MVNNIHTLEKPSETDKFCLALGALWRKGCGDTENVKWDLALKYNESFFTDEEVEYFKEELSKKDTILLSHENKDAYYACLDIFVPVIEIFLSSDIVQSVLVNLGSDILYDGLKFICDKIYQKFHNKKMLKMTSVKTEEKTPNIQMVFGNNRLVLPIEIDKEKYEFAIKEFVKGVALCQAQEKTFAIYDENENKLINKTQNEIVREEIEKSRNKTT